MQNYMICNEKSKHINIDLSISYKSFLMCRIENVIAIPPALIFMSVLFTRIGA